ncbi:hypothetical protein ACIBL8_08265 [Streptomyces sp. NPDC050523]|uniref:hypothetical protein n=1 Tax=Streptomyces sp. NPDC050523 TaxID=3365622 RepID=UPI0037B939E7
MSDLRGQASGLAAGEERYQATQGDAPVPHTVTPSGIVCAVVDVPSAPQDVLMPGFYASGVHWTHTAAGQAYLRRCRTGRL